MKKRVVIVGAGVVGLHCAVRLAKAGAQVTLLEAEAEHPTQYGPMASAAAAGMLAPFEIEKAEHEKIAFQSFELWKRLRDGAEWSDGVRFDGAALICSSEDQLRLANAHAARLGRSAEPLSANQFERRTGLRTRQDHALFIADEGIADPLRVLTGLAMQARALGVLVEFQKDVRSATESAVMTHDDRVYEADAVLLAPGAWATEALLNAAPSLKHVRPGKGHLATVKLHARLAPNIRAPGFYLARQRDEAVIGSTLELDRYDRRVEKEKVAALVAAARAAFPNEIEAGERAWAGIRPMSPDGWPLIGPDKSGIFVAAGHARNGWLLAPITAEIISAYVMGGAVAPEWAALSPQRFEAS
jgi:glycine oxidase